MSLWFYYNSCSSFGDITRAYLSKLWKLRDPKMDGLPLMGGIENSMEEDIPFAGLMPTVLLCLIYVIFCAWLGPLFMANRKAFDLYWAILLSNALQVVINLYGILMAPPLMYRMGFNFVCQAVDHSTDPDPTALAFLSYIFFIVKFLDLLDTVFFVLRKKTSQITFLHVYHHAVMPIYLWLGIRFLPGGNNLFGSYINGAIHVFMYSYYFISALGPKYRWLLFWKRYMTTAQIIQFVVVLCHSFLQLVIPDCGFPKEQTVASLFLVIPFLCLFLNFYLKEYVFKTNRRSVRQLANGDLKKKL